jgi:hypothetical protein
MIPHPYAAPRSTRAARRLRLVFATLAALVVLVLVDARPAAAQGPTLDLAAYEQLLREAQAAAARGDRISLDEAAPRLVAAATVRLPDGSVARADNAWLATELAQPNPRLDRVAERLGALVDALAAPPPSAPADAQARLAAILSRPPFGDSGDEPREPGWLERFFEWLAELLGDIAVPVGDAATSAPGTVASWALTAAGAALVIAVLALWLRGLRRSLRPTAALAPAATPEARDQADARAQAGALARAGDYRGAVRLLALAALLWLDEGGHLRYDSHQTNREHLQRLRDKPDLRSRLAPVVDTADRVWYGNTPLDAAGYAAYERQVDALQEPKADAP